MDRRIQQIKQTLENLKASRRNGKEEPMKRAFWHENDELKKQDTNTYHEFEWGGREDRFLHSAMNQVCNKSVTENGAVGYKTTFQPLVDLNFKVSFLRNQPENYIVKEFIKAYYHSPHYAVKWMFFIRDIKEGLGERKSRFLCWLSGFRV